jgi:hypothetical protein
VLSFLHGADLILNYFMKKINKFETTRVKFFFYLIKSKYIFLKVKNKRELVKSISLGEKHQKLRRKRSPGIGKRESQFSTKSTNYQFQKCS